VSCAFTLEHYRELLRAAREGGYRWAFFDHEPKDGDLILRHDVDLSLDAALRMAELEAEEGAAATYFLMTESVFYNLASSEGRAALERLEEAADRHDLAEDERNWLKHEYMLRRGQAEDDEDGAIARDALEAAEQTDIELLAAAREEHTPPPTCGEQARHGRADPPSATGHQHHPPLRHAGLPSPPSLRPSLPAHGRAVIPRALPAASARHEGGTQRCSRTTSSPDSACWSPAAAPASAG
jgi:hypothetical protein